MTKVQTIVAIVALVVAIFSLVYTTFQVGIATADLEARSRPYLSIEKIGLGNTGDGVISTNITINNLGEIPATRVKLGEVFLDGERIAGTSQPDKDYPVRVRTTQDGVTISAGGLVVTPTHSGLPDDMIFFPQKPNTIELLTLGSIQASAITDGSLVDIELIYSWGDREYWYMATVMLSEGVWEVILERGD